MSETSKAAQLQEDSLKREEPKWLLEKREAAFEQIDKLDFPRMQRFHYKNWPLMENESIKPFDSDPALIEKDENANLIQFGQTTVSVSLDEEMKQDGVILSDIFSAIKNHPELVQKYLMTEVIDANEDKLTANHMAYFNSGLFLYIPKNVQVKNPIEVDLIQDSTQDANWNPHILIVAEQGSSVKFLQHLSTVGDHKNTASMMVEIVANPESKVEFSSLEEISKQTTLYFNRRAKIKKDAHVEWAIGFMNDCDTIGDIDSELIGEGSYANSQAIAVTSGKQKMGINNRVTNRGPHSTGLINQRGVLLEDSNLIFNGIGQIVHGAHGSKADQQNRVLMMSDNAHGDANPLLLIDENDVIAAHAASVGPVDQIQMDYLMSRGIPYDQAERLVIRGFLGAVLDSIPDKSVRAKMIKILERKLIDGQRKAVSNS
ncbi:Fe-S cluster assembly protein SufD [uncultured Lactobacillus sp.]|uniref:Fe-S cluster assembly protein SufD n=1 Tax=uncultured Lactobacillus sp. TaxID=153152 RepID=UPI0028046414|nr:Fe-S cluster assembly protein SufD [uncultured Lactobacillus sp.]